MTGARGPVSKNENVRVLHGDKAGRLENAKPKLPFGEPDFPPWLAEGDLAKEGRRIWDETIDDLRKLRSLAHCDGPALAAYVEAVLINEASAKEINEKGLIIKGYRGSRVKNPALTPWMNSADKIRAFAREFGLTPAGRSGIDLPEDPGDGKSASRFFS